MQVHILSQIWLDVSADGNSSFKFSVRAYENKWKVMLRIE